MYLLQGLIFCAVVGSNIHWQWTPNQYLASGIGVGLSWIATMAIVEFQDSRGPPQIAQVAASPDVTGAAGKFSLSSCRGLGNGSLLWKPFRLSL